MKKRTKRRKKSIKKLDAELDAIMKLPLSNFSGQLPSAQAAAGLQGAEKDSGGKET
jgi:hypothetical protein